MAAPNPNDKNELILSPSQYAYMQDTTKGVCKVYVGPIVINRSGQEAPIVYEHGTGFQRVEVLEQAVRDFAVAPQGHYLVLFNPAPDAPNSRPSPGAAQMSPDLIVGRRVNIPGPCHFALWPGQKADLVRGHELRSNQYLLCRVYDADEATKNWGSAVVKAATTDGDDKTKADKQKPDKLERPTDLSPGTLLIIRGTDVSFFIPPTGITVVPDETQEDEDKLVYVRSALTLERLEYAVLVDENGKKRYEHGPQVVFPRPSERFVTDKDGQRKFAAVELNEIQGIHIKVIADYVDGEKKYAQGSEMFVTGKDTPIYFPREEHSIVMYDDKTKHFATAVPAGEGRYVMDRTTGNIELVRGPKMLLPNPVAQVIVRRPLSDQQCVLWYPGNAEALQYNRTLRQVEAEKTRSPTPDSNVVRTASIGTRGSMGATSKGTYDAEVLYAAAQLNSLTATSHVDVDQQVMGDAFTRGSSYTQPRTLTLNTKLQGVPTINVWTGFAIAVRSKVGKLRVVQGPTTELLQYDEDLEILELSTGKPKSTDRLLQTVYLQISGNRVSDIVAVETKDMVTFKVQLNYLVEFGGADPTKWFAVSNYVKMLCDRGRSMLKSAIRKLTVDEFHGNATQIIRDLILGEKKDAQPRPGMQFPQNGMAVNDLDVINVTIEDQRIKAMIDLAQHEAVKSTLDLTKKRRELSDTETATRIDGEINRIRHDAEVDRLKLIAEMTQLQLTQKLTELANLLAVAAERYRTSEAEQKLLDFTSAKERERDGAQRRQQLEIQQLELGQDLERLSAETKAVLDRFNAAGGSFSTAVAAMHDKVIIERVAQAFNVPSMIGGKNLVDSVQKIFAGTPLGTVIDKALIAAAVPSNGAGATVPRS